ncbi:osmoprotectant transport system ATP-binding protein [Granulicella rosea]|uniref:Osmoprotectant transport system ATP-binding protein n=1 Tax=Granulicella rosea TaxID=474952 RepID=A0A239HDJ4_9BACT|nr:ATP-binding cassette domain-containing protein [Granulicella rosea]SNS78324.1 osmoprotectant transport system ATP-binding protein [Granulicella rosea]
MPESSVEFSNVSYALPSGRLLLEDVSLRLEPGTTTALLGRSGSGKTTLLRMVNGLVMPTSGETLVSGRPSSGWDLLELRRGIGYVIQETGLFPHMNVARNAGLAMELARRPAAEIAERVAAVMNSAGLDPSFANRMPWELSGGQRQRVGLARALATDPGILLMDEPFGALDPMTRAEMQTMLRDLLHRVRKTVLLVTHDLDEALYLAERVVFVESGKLVAELAACEVLRSENPHVQAYVNAVHRAVR